MIGRPATGCSKSIRVPAPACSKRHTLVEQRGAKSKIKCEVQRMRVLAALASAAAVGAFSAQSSIARRPAVTPTALSSTRRDPITGKIYVGEPEPLEELADLVGGLLGGLGRVADGLLGPAPVPIPVPVEDERDQAPEQPPVGTDPYKYPGTY